jgi:hypothetical protein
MRIIDVTGDGLPDILQCASSSVTDCKSWINTGAGWRRNDAYKPKTITAGGFQVLYLCHLVGST